MSGGFGGQAGGLQPEHGDREGGWSGRRAQEAEDLRPGVGEISGFRDWPAQPACLPSSGGAPGGGWELTGPFSDHGPRPLATRPGALRYAKGLSESENRAHSKLT